MFAELKAAQSLSHHSIRSKGMASISAAEKPVSLAKALAATRCVSALKFILFDQAKIAGLQAVVVTQAQGGSFGSVRVGTSPEKLTPSTNRFMFFRT